MRYYYHNALVCTRKYEKITEWKCSSITRPKTVEWTVITFTKAFWVVRKFEIAFHIIYTHYYENDNRKHLYSAPKMHNKCGRAKHPNERYSIRIQDIQHNCTSSHSKHSYCTLTRIHIRIIKFKRIASAMHLRMWINTKHFNGSYYVFKSIFPLAAICQFR